MNATQTKTHKGHMMVDNAANAVVIAAGLLIVLFAVAAGDTGPAPAPQVAQQIPIGRLVVTAQRPKAEKENFVGRARGREDSVQVAASSPEGAFDAVSTNVR